MNQILNFLIQYKEFAILFVALVFGVIFYGKKNVEKFVLKELSNLEQSVLANVKANPVKFAMMVYAKMPASLKTFATINMIAKFASKFLDK